MKKLKEDVYKEFTDFGSEVVEAMKEAESSGSLSLEHVLTIFGSSGPHYAALDKAFEEFRERNTGKKKLF